MSRRYGGYYRGPEPDEDTGGMFYDPYSPRTDLWGGLRRTINNLVQFKEQRRKEDYLRKQQEFENSLAERKQTESEAETKDRQGLYRAQTLAALGKSNVDKTFKVSPVALQSLGKTLNYPPEFLDGISAMSPEAQEDFFNKAMTGIAQLNLEAKKQAGPLAQVAADRAAQSKRDADLKRQGGLLTAAVTAIQQLKRPLEKQRDATLKSPMLLDEASKMAAIAPFQSQLDNIDTAAGEIAAYMATLATGNTLPDEAVKKVQLYLNNLNKIKTGEIWENPAAQNVGESPDFAATVVEIKKRKPGISQKEAEKLAAQYLAGR